MSQELQRASSVFNPHKRLSLRFMCTRCGISYHAQYGNLPMDASWARAYFSCPQTPLDTLLEPYPQASAVQGRCISCQGVFKISSHQSQKFRRWLELQPPPRGMRNLTMSTPNDTDDESDD